MANSRLAGYNIENGRIVIQEKGRERGNYCLNFRKRKVKN